MAGRNEKKNITKSKIVNYIINNKIISNWQKYAICRANFL